MYRSMSHKELTVRNWLQATLISEYSKSLVNCVTEPINPIIANDFWVKYFKPKFDVQYKIHRNELLTLVPSLYDKILENNYNPDNITLNKILSGIDHKYLHIGKKAA